jgi:hypothetical protein
LRFERKIKETSCDEKNRNEFLHHLLLGLRILLKAYPQITFPPFVKAGEGDLKCQPWPNPFKSLFAKRDFTNNNY